MAKTWFSFDGISSVWCLGSLYALVLDTLLLHNDFCSSFRNEEEKKEKTGTYLMGEYCYVNDLNCLQIMNTRRDFSRSSESFHKEWTSDRSPIPASGTRLVAAFLSVRITQPRQRSCGILIICKTSMSLRTYVRSDVENIANSHLTDDLTQDFSPKYSQGA